MGRRARDLLSDLGQIGELDYDSQAYETALWEGGYDDPSFGFHTEEIDNDTDKDPDYLEEEEEEQ